MDHIIEQEKHDRNQGRLVKRKITFDGVDFELSHSASIYGQVAVKKGSTKDEDEEVPQVNGNGVHAVTLKSHW